MIAALLALGGGLPVALAGEPEICHPTPPDMLGPFYVPGAPERSKVGTGYLLQGTVRSAPNCEPIPGAVIELWLAGPDGNYHDDYRATVVAGEMGRYRFESQSPGAYFNRPPHIHLKVTAKGHHPLITQHYANPAENTAIFDLVLMTVE